MSDNSGEIGVGLTFKKNLGNYENVDLTASVKRNVEDVHDQLQWASIWEEVDNQIDGQLKEVSK